MGDVKKYLFHLRERLFTGHYPDLTVIGGRWLECKLPDIISGKPVSGAGLYQSLINFGWDPNSFSFDGLGDHEGLPVMIAARNIIAEKKSFRTKKKQFSDRLMLGEMLSDLYCVFYLPAILMPDGSLKPGNWQWPWFEQMLMHPFVDEETAIADISVYGDYINARKAVLPKIPDWKTWVSLAIDMYKQCTGQAFTDSKIKNMDLDDVAYVIPDIKTFHSASLARSYDELLVSQTSNLLLNNMLSEFEVEDKTRRFPTGVTASYAHSGHMDCSYPLFESQRRVVEQMLSVPVGGILAINSPLGSKPMSCVSDHIASKLVNAAVLGEKPPKSAIIVRDSRQISQVMKEFKFDCISEDSEQEALLLLGQNWIDGMDCMAAAVIEKCCFNNLNNQGKMTVGICSDMGVAGIDNPQKIKEMTENVMEQCSNFFKEKLNSLDKCKNRLHETLVAVNYASQSLLQTAAKIQEFMRSNSLSQDILFFPEDELNDVTGKRQKLVDRLEEWRKHFKSVPLSLRIGANSDLGKIKLKAFYEAFRKEDELEHMPSIESIEDVERGLAKMDREYAQIQPVLEEIVRQQDKAEMMVRKLGKIGLDIETMEKNISQPDRINADLDNSLRLLAFWLAVHYYECRWLSGESIVLMHQRNRVDPHAAGRYLDRLSLIAPCLIAEPGVLCQVNGLNPSKLDDLYVLTSQDWLLAETVPCLTLTKRIYAIGDPAASRITPFIPLDQPYVKPKKKRKEDVVEGISLPGNGTQEELCKIPGFVGSAANGIGIGGGIVVPDKNGDNSHNVQDQTADGQTSSQTDNKKHDQLVDCFASDLLSQAADRGLWYMWNRDGLWLSDQVTSYEEISNYGSWLYFNDKIKARRGAASASSDKRFRQWLPMSLWQVDTGKAERKAFDFYQPKEAEEIVRLLKNNYENIKISYPDTDPSSLLAIVTPFEAQAEELKRRIAKDCGHLSASSVKVGCMREFAEGEAYKIIMFSAVYGRSDGCRLYEQDNSCLYRAVSMATDTFLYVGDINALPEKGRSPAAQLRKKLKPQNRKK